MNAFHSNWTAPYLTNSKAYEMKDYEILITILSALKRKKKNGSIKMITDKIGENYYKKIGIEPIWDLGIECKLDTINNSVNKQIFWAAGKIYALSMQDCPIAMIDTDFVIWDTLDADIKESSLAVIHREGIDNFTYPDKEYFNLKEGYSFDLAWNWKVEPCNTAFAYFNNKEFIKEYTKQSISFMENAIVNDNRITNMVFAEQRIIAMVADKMDLNIHEMETLDKLLRGKQKKYTHLWGYKTALNNDETLRNLLCQQLINRIKIDFPEYRSMLKKIEQISTKYNI
ncbi:MAG: hypothetical protein MJ191_05530 [Clostridium sp.]|nr:hypothetical protein [Clostridium sp.]